MGQDVDEELSEVEERLREEEESEVLLLSPEASEALLEALWDRVDDKMVRQQDQVLELREDVRKLTKLILARVEMQGEANRRAEEDSVGNHRENDMSEANAIPEAQKKGFDYKKAALVTGGVVLAAGAGYGLGRWHASKKQQAALAGPSK